MDAHMNRSFKTRRSKATSAVRALDVLEYFGELRQPLRGKQLVEGLGLPQSSTEQLLKTMVEAGYLVFDPVTKLYDISFRLTKLGGWLATECFRTGMVDEVLNELHAATESSVFLAQRTGNFMRVMDYRIDNRTMVAEDNGCLLPFNAMTGQAYLASHEDRDSHLIVEYAAMHWNLPKNSSHDLMERVRAVRNIGYAVGATYTQDQCSISVPVILDSSKRSRTLALSVTGPKARIRRNEGKIIDLVRESATRILDSHAANLSQQAEPSRSVQ